MDQNLKDVKAQLKLRGWFPGGKVGMPAHPMNQYAHFLTDGQYGSTGKGVIAAAMAEMFGNDVDFVTSNAGPNSGHTSYIKGEKVVLKQLPTFSVAHKLLTGHDIITALNAGAVIDRKLLEKECTAHDVWPFVHPFAAEILPHDKKEDKKNVSGMASTGQGVGPAMIRKLGRDSKNVYGCHDSLEPNFSRGLANKDLAVGVGNIWVETSQGYSLGLNSGFYPHVTTRECTVTQAMSDAGLSPLSFYRSILSVRTFPIRVGNTEASSGPCYDDQKEITWEELGVEPEVTTVTNRIRRVFTWSDKQFAKAVRANASSVIFLNFMNYLPEHRQKKFVENMIDVYQKTMGVLPEAIILGFGPKSSDIKLY